MHLHVQPWTWTPEVYSPMLVQSKIYNGIGWDLTEYACKQLAIINSRYHHITMLWYNITNYDKVRNNKEKAKAGFPAKAIYNLYTRIPLIIHTEYR